MKKGFVMFVMLLSLLKGFGWARASREATTTTPPAVATAPVYPDVTRSMMAGKAAVVGDYPESAVTAWKILEQGGTAFDAAVGMAATMGIVNQSMNDIFGGDAMIIIYSAKDKKLINYNGSGWAPAAATIDRYIDSGGIPVDGILSVEVPGSFSGWMTLMKDYGTMPLSQVLAPAIHLANNGWQIRSGHARSIATNLAKFNQEALNVYAPNGVALKEGEIAYNKNMANLLTTLGKMSYQDAEDYIYRGPVAKALVDLSDSLGGLIKLSDMNEFRAAKATPLSTNYKGVDVYVCPPNSQGMVLLEALNILETYDVKSFGHNTAEYIDLLAQILNLAIEDRNAWMGDPRFVPIPYGMITKEYAKVRKNDIKLRQAMPDTIKIGNPTPYNQNYTGEKGGDTTFMVVADAMGNIVACTTSICQGWGSKLMIPGYGVMLNDRMTYFLLDESSPNHLLPRKRTMQTITPSIALKNGAPYLAWGTPGADLQEQMKLQVFLNVFEWGMNAQKAVEAPRIQTLHPTPLMDTPGFGAPPRHLSVELRVSIEERNKLEKMGYILRGGDWSMGGAGTMGLIKINPATGWKETGADPRGNNTAIAW
jgi:gamma-glutamyltranspeptidase / glutathione hydrolase